MERGFVGDSAQEDAASSACASREGSPLRASRPPECWLSDRFSELHEQLWSYVRRRVYGSGEAASDIVQDAFARLCLEPWPEIETYATAWLYRTCRNKAIDYCRREGRMPVTENSADVSSVADRLGTAPDAELEHAEQVDELRSQIQRLTDQQQEVLRLRLQDGLSYKQISEVTGMTVTNVGYHLHQAIVCLRDRMA